MRDAVTKPIISDWPIMMHHPDHMTKTSGLYLDLGTIPFDVPGSTEGGREMNKGEMMENCRSSRYQTEVGTIELPFDVFKLGMAVVCQG